MQSQGALLVVVERGGRLPVWLGRCQEVVTDVIVLVAGADEALVDFSARLQQRLTALAETDEQLTMAVLVAAEGDELVAVAETRTAIAKMVLGQLRRDRPAHLLLVTGDALTVETRFQLLSLAGVLAQEIRGTCLTVGVRFGAADGDVVPPELKRVRPAHPRSHQIPPDRSEVRGEALESERPPRGGSVRPRLNSAS